MQDAAGFIQGVPLDLRAFGYSQQMQCYQQLRLRPVLLESHRAQGEAGVPQEAAVWGTLRCSFRCGRNCALGSAFSAGFSHREAQFCQEK